MFSGVIEREYWHETGQWAELVQSEQLGHLNNVNGGSLSVFILNFLSSALIYCFFGDFERVTRTCLKSTIETLAKSMKYVQS